MRGICNGKGLHGSLLGCYEHLKLILPLGDLFHKARSWKVYKNIPNSDSDIGSHQASNVSTRLCDDVLDFVLQLFSAGVCKNQGAPY